MLTPQSVAELVKSHDDYFDTLRDSFRQYRRLYMTRWNDPALTSAGERTQLPKAYAVVESYLGSLYAKDPAVNVEPDLRARGNPQVAAATANQYLLSVREQLEDATRLALIYPCSFLKLAPVQSVDPLKRVACSAIPPWEIIVDAAAASWDQQRHIGHAYQMPLDEAVKRYSKKAEDFRPHPYVKWIEAAGATREGGLGVTATFTGQGAQAAIPSTEQWVRVVEMYDLLDDKLVVWCPDYLDASDFVFEGVQVQVGALEEEAGAEAEAPQVELQHETTGIPYKSASGRPIVPIIPLYFSRDPDYPMRGYSLVGRSLDQFREINVMRTYQSRGVRRMARQWMVRAGFLSEDACAKIAEGIDGEFVEVDAQPGTPLEGNVVPVPNAPIPADIEAYALTVSNDIDQAGVLAPFTRGEATGTTATEQQLLATYTSSEIGRMARIRDAAITSIAFTYNVVLSVILGDESEALDLPNPVGPTILSAADLTGDFRYWAVDAGSTPMSTFAKQQTLERVAPLLVQLGADPKAVLEEVVRAFQLPEDLAKLAPPPPAAPPAGPPPTPAPEV